MARISGEVDWQRVTFNVPAGTRQLLKWRYSKNTSTVAGQDAGFVDGIEYTMTGGAVPPVVTNSPVGRVVTAGDTLVLEAGTDVGGTWYWNRYPGARFDSESYTYGYSFSKELLAEWTWSEHFAAQPETLRYLQHVTERFGLRPHMRFGCRVVCNTWNDETGHWTVELADGRTFTCRLLLTAIGLPELITETLADYEALAQAGRTFKGLLTAQAVVQRGEGERQKEHGAGDFRAAMGWLMSQAEAGVGRQRYKGLGEMNPEQLWETTLNPDTRRMLPVFVEAAGEGPRDNDAGVFEMMMAKENAAQRRVWMEAFGNLVDADIS